MAVLSERARAFLQEKPRFGVLGTVNADGSPLSCEQVVEHF